MKVFITKYALTSGVEVKEATVWKENTNCIHIEGAVWNGFFCKPDWHDNWVDALARCEKMRSAKVKSCKKQLAKLEKMEFKEPQQDPSK